MGLAKIFYGRFIQIHRKLEHKSPLSKTKLTQEKITSMASIT